MMVRTLITAAALIAASAGVTLAQDVDKGAIVFKKCGICHKIGPGISDLWAYLKQFDAEGNIKK